MIPRKAVQDRGRARRFALRVPVHFREVNSPTWLEGTTKNISYTGVLFQSSEPLPPETTLELRLRVKVGNQGSSPTEIRCKGTVVRLEQEVLPETPIAVGFAIKAYWIVSEHSSHESPAENA